MSKAKKWLLVQFYTDNSAWAFDVILLVLGLLGNHIFTFRGASAATFKDHYSTGAEVLLRYRTA